MSRTILVFDQNPSERSILSGFLCQEYTVLEAQNRKKALSLLREKRELISAVILSAGLPDESGFEFLRQIKGNPDFERIPVIVATELNDEESREKAISCGADNCITLPYHRTLALHIVQNTVKLQEISGMVGAVWRDRVTGLLNRDSFFNEAERMIRHHDPGHYIVSSVDVENFKVINDQYGTDVGDCVLKHIAEVLSGFVADSSGLTCHYTADKFIVLFPSALAGSELATNVYKAACRPKCLNRPIRIRIGRYLIDDPSLPVSAMLDRAMLAESTIKRRYDVYIAEYDDSMRTRLLREQQIVNGMERALEHGEFETFLQPQYNHANGALIGAEALVRWNSKGKYISPGEFIPIFERNGFIYEMDQFVWNRVCALLRKWLDEGKDPLPISINISRRDLQHRHFVEILTGIVGKYRLPYSLLRLEVTESAFADASVVQKVDTLIDLGFTVEIDDFGSGYSSLNTLKDVPASILKLDMKFFENTKNSPRSGNIIESVVRMAQWLGMAVIAEGVEKREQADFLKSIGCYYIQGYYYAAPMPVAEFEKLMDSECKEPKLSGLTTVDMLNNDEFWNPNSIETLIFNSYVGGACIFEFCNGETELLRMNAQYPREFGKLLHPDTRLSDASIMRFLSKEEHDKVLRMIFKSLDTMKEVSDEITVSNGTVTEYIRITVRIIARAGNRSLCYAVLVNDTAQHEAIRQKEEAARKLSVVLENMDGGVSVFLIGEDKRGTMLFDNEKYYKLYGYTKAEAKARNLHFMDCMVPEDREAVIAGIRRIRTDGHPAQIDYRIIRQDGVLAYLRANVSLIDMQNGANNVIACVTTDITALREAQKKESETAQKLTAVMNSAGNGFSAVILYDSGPELLFVNDKYYEIHGIPRDDTRFLDLRASLSLVHPEDRAALREKAAHAKTAGERTEIEYRVICPNGKIKWIKAVVSQTVWKGIDAPIEVTAFTDISEDRAADEQLRFLNDSAHDILAQPDIEMAMNKTLEKLLAYFEADRAYVVELDYQSRTTDNTFEVCAPDVRSEMNLLHGLPFSASDFWLTSLQKSKYMAIGDVSALGPDQADLRALLEEQDIRSILIAPLYRDGVLVGFTGIDNPKTDIRKFDRLVALSDYIAVLLTRRDLTRKIEQEKESGRRKSERQKTEMLDYLPCGAMLCEYDDRGISVIHVNKSYWQLIGRKPEEKTQQIFDFIHPEDRAWAIDALERAIRAGQNFSSDIRILNGQNVYRHFLVNANILPATDGKYSLIVSYTPKQENVPSLQDLLPIALSTMMSTSQDLGFVKGPNGHYLCCSQSVISLLGLSEERELVGKTDWDIFDKDLAARFSEDDRMIFETGKPLIDRLFRIPDANGSLRVINISKYPLLDEEGKVIGLYSTGHDVTQAQKTDFELRSLLRVIPSGVLKYSAGDKDEFEYINRNFIRDLGYTEEQFRQKFGNRFRNMIYEEDRPFALQEILRQENGGNVGKFDYRIEDAEGKLHWFHDEGVKVTDHEGKEWYYVTLVDITEQKETENRLRLAKEEYRVAVRHSGHTIGRYNIEGRTLTITEDTASKNSSPECIEDVPYGRVKAGIISAKTADAYITFYENIMHGQKEGSVTFQKHLPCGWRWITEYETTIFDESGKPASAIISYLDVTDHQEKEIAYKKWEQSLQEKKPDAFTLYRCTLNPNATYSSVDGTLLGFSTDRALPVPFGKQAAEFAAACVAPEDRAAYLSFVDTKRLFAAYTAGKRSDTLEFRGRTGKNLMHWLRLTVDLVAYPFSGDIEAFLMFEDINEFKTIQLKTQELADTDPLTGLLNRKAFSEKMENLLKNTTPGTLTALFLIDMDGFKSVNDHFGHSAGDQILIDAGNAIRSVVRESDPICRLGGDEFLVCMPNMPDKNIIMEKARQICALTRRSLSFDIQLTITLGISVFPLDGHSFTTLYRNADKAMYQVKGNGKNNCAFYEPEKDTDLLPEPEPAQPRTVAQRRILIAGQNEDDVRLLCQSLRGSFTVDQVENEEQAMLTLRRFEREISVILLDLALPDEGARRILENLQKNEQWQFIPVIVLGRAGDREAKLHTVCRSAYDFIQKPLDADLLRMRVEWSADRFRLEHQRMQNKWITVQQDEVRQIRLLLEDTESALIEYRVNSSSFQYDFTISSLLSGNFDQRPFWTILREDEVATKGDAGRLKAFLDSQFSDRTSKINSLILNLKTKSGQWHTFRIKALKCDSEEGPDEKMLITVTDLNLVSGRPQR